MNKFLSGKRAIVTGGSKGIGFAVARALLQSGSGVVICGRSQSSLESALSNLRKETDGNIAAGVTADVSDSADVARLFQYADSQFGGLDLLINNAGFGIFRPAAELTIEEWNHLIGTNLSGAFYCSREALARFKSNGGSIINISSLAGRNPIAGGAAYNASKFGMNGFSEAMMLDHRNEDVRVSYIMPGSVNTDFDGASGNADWKIAPEDIAEIVLDILRMPMRTLISRIEVRPSKPRKN